MSGTRESEYRDTREVGAERGHGRNVSSNDPTPIDPADELGALPAAYAVALRLDRIGESHDRIAYALGLDAAAVPSLLVLARAKLAAGGGIGTGIE